MEKTYYITTSPQHLFPQSINICSGIWGLKGLVASNRIHQPSLRNLTKTQWFQRRCKFSILYDSTNILHLLKDSRKLKDEKVTPYPACLRGNITPDPHEPAFSRHPGSSIQEASARHLRHLSRIINR